MSVVLFSRAGIHYKSEGKGPITAVFMPSAEQVRHYSDLTTITTSTVAERYGEVSELPLWRKEDKRVAVYGTILTALRESRKAVEVFLPQDFLDRDVEVFYFVFGARWVVHGVRTVDDDGRSAWGLSNIDGRQEGVINSIVNAISDRMLDGDEEKTCIAVEGGSEMFEKLQMALEPLGHEVRRFESLSYPKRSQSLYFHRDYSLLMLTGALFALLVLAAVVAYYVFGQVELDQVRNDNYRLEREIRQMQQQRRLGHIKNPQEILRAMSQPLPVPPSGVIHATAEVGSIFGELEWVEFDRATKPVDLKERGGQYGVGKAFIRKIENALLVDQEQVAQSALASRPWIRRLESVYGAQPGSIRLNVILKLE